MRERAGELRIVRPRLALAGYDLAEEALAQPRVREAEAYVRTRVLARASKALTREAIEENASAALKRALSHHENLLSVFEYARARDWATHTPEEAVREALLAVLFGEEDLSARVEAFLEAASSRELEPGRVAAINETVTSYILAMHDPERHAFAKPSSALQPAWRLLVDPSGDRAPTGPERVAWAAAFYGALRDLWEAERGFEGDLLDVHTRLYLLGSGRTIARGWVDALTPEDVVELAGGWSEGEASVFARAGALMRETCFDGARPADPYGGITLEDYAYVYGGQERTLSWMVEHAARDLIEVTIDDASVFGVGAGGDGSWRVGRRSDAGKEEAQAEFEMRVRPRLSEIAEVAGAMITGESPALSALAGEHYREVDGKLLLLTLAAYDTEWAWAHAAPTVRGEALRRAGALLGLEVPEVETFRDYVEVQLGLDAAWRVAGGVSPLGDFVRWIARHPLGRTLGRLAGPLDAPSADAVEEAAAEVVEAPARPAEVGRRWVALLGELAGEELEGIARLLRARKNVVLYGPPGTGKTVLSVRLARAWTRWQGDGSVEKVTFHPSYGYEEFIEGYRPMPDRPEAFGLRDGALWRLADRARAEPERAFLLLIDELNRGDVARIFGEAITLIEPDKRGREHARRAMLSQRELWVPPNVHVLGTMNTADKSVSLLDVAIRRRFAFKSVGPSPALLDRAPGLVREIRGVRLSSLLRRINANLHEIGVGAERHIGHSYFWLVRGEVGDAASALMERFEVDVIPLVEEYCFSDRGQMRRVLGEVVDTRGRPRVHDVEGFFGALEGLLEGE
jgi:5-methylcytosine-specific restriction protein B